MITQEDVNQLQSASARRVQLSPKTFRRYLFDKIKWDNRLISILGPRGCGKTTLMLQYIRECIPDKSTAIYISLDNMWFASHDIVELVEYFYTHGIRHLFIDEVHYFPLWQRLMKNLYDNYPDLHVVFSGSSMLQIDHAQADLSRRLARYRLEGLSFREYLKFEGVCDIPPLSLEQLLTSYTEVSAELSSTTSILPHFERYCRIGYFPFYKDTHDDYGNRLVQVANQVLESDYPTVEDITPATTRKMRKMLMILAESVPQVVNMSNLFRELETDRNQGLKMLYAMQRGGLLNLLGDDSRCLKRMSRPDKIYLGNPNLMYALTPRVDIGTLRETFFLCQMQAVADVSYPKQGDFLVDHRYLFEVGGRGKGFSQIADQPDSFLAVDGIEYGSFNRIPLWMFGLLY